MTRPPATTARATSRRGSTRRAWPLAAVALAAGCYASVLVEGDALRIFYSNGLWGGIVSTTGDTGAEESQSGSIQFQVDGTWWDFGNGRLPWVLQGVAWTDAAGGAQLWSNFDTTSAGTTTYTDAVLSTDTQRGYQAIYGVSDLSLVRTETWDASGTTILVRVNVTNNSADDLADVRIVQAFNAWDVVYVRAETLNDALDTDGDGVRDLAVSTSASSAAPFTLAYGACDEARQEVGHAEEDPSLDKTLFDDDGVTGDRVLHLRHVQGALRAGQVVETGFVVIAARSVEEAQALWAAARVDCPGCDEDDDGVASLGCGGLDCDDADPAVHAGAGETWYDGVDQDCAGDDDFDADADGWRPDDGDCDDEAPSTHPGADETWYDGVDQDCAGDDDFDADADGHAPTAHGGDDCDDTDAAVFAGAPEIAHDGVDQDCSGGDLLDGDGDGEDALSAGGADCDDTDAAIHTGATDLPGDAVDQDCDGADQCDIDGDGAPNLACADGCDNDDEDPTVNCRPLDARESPGVCGCDGGGTNGGLGTVVLAGALLAWRARRRPTMSDPRWMTHTG